MNMTAIVQANILGIVLMAITLVSLSKHYKASIVADKIFFLFTFFVMLSCLFEILGFVFIGKTFVGARTLNFISNVLLFAISSLPAFFWALYVHCKVYKDELKLKKSFKYLIIPVIVFMLISIANIFFDIVFKLTPDNMYVRAKFYLISFGLSFFYMVYVIAILIKESKTVETDVALPLISFMILPTIGMIAQYIFYGISIIWISTAVSVVIIFNYVQNDYSITDWLTGAYNRKHLDIYMEQLCKRKRTKLFVGFMIDINSFKCINDTYGHLVGDEALIITANLLKSACGRKSYISRYAGDEFIVLIETKTLKDVQNIADNIHQHFNNFNLSNIKPYKLKLSIGYAVFNEFEKDTQDKFLSRMDKNMYMEKTKYHREIAEE